MYNNLINNTEKLTLIIVNLLDIWTRIYKRLSLNTDFLNIPDYSNKLNSFVKLFGRNSRYTDYWMACYKFSDKAPSEIILKPCLYSSKDIFTFNHSTVEQQFSQFYKELRMLMCCLTDNPQLLFSDIEDMMDRRKGWQEARDNFDSAEYEKTIFYLQEQSYNRLQLVKEELSKVIMVEADFDGEEVLCPNFGMAFRNLLINWRQLYEMRGLSIDFLEDIDNCEFLEDFIKQFGYRNPLTLNSIAYSEVNVDSITDILNPWLLYDELAQKHNEMSKEDRLMRYYESIMLIMCSLYTDPEKFFREMERERDDLQNKLDDFDLDHANDGEDRSDRNRSDKEMLETELKWVEKIYDSLLDIDLIMDPDDLS